MRRAATIVALAIAFLATTGCAGTPKGTVEVDYDEFTIRAKPSSAPTGDVRFRQRNVGALTHELVIVETALEHEALPVKAGQVVLEAKELRVAGRDKLLAADSTRTAAIPLEPGKYVLICNVAGHYQSGMHTPFTVH
jgi:uncharacterized cupredoxin-like copper-binding protein